MYRGYGKVLGGMGHWNTLTMDDCGCECGWGLMYKGCGRG